MLQKLKLATDLFKENKQNSRGCPGMGQPLMVLTYSMVIIFYKNVTKNKS